MSPAELDVVHGHDDWAPAEAHDRRAAEDLLYLQAELLDGRRWREFIDLFTADGRYWMPARAGQSDPDAEPSIFAEDRDMMGLRAARLSDPTAWSLAAHWATSHVVGSVRVFASRSQAQRLLAVSRFHLAELRRDSTRHFSGRYAHQLVRTDAGLRIGLQRVDLLQAQAPFDYVLQAWV